MKVFEATEQAYKNGYEQGKKDALKWIPVGEKSPEYGDRVIACGAKGGVFMVRATSITGFGKVDGASNHRYYTHWMPLPEPPKGE